MDHQKSCISLFFEKLHFANFFLFPKPHTYLQRDGGNRIAQLNSRTWFFCDKPLPCFFCFPKVVLASRAKTNKQDIHFILFFFHGNGSKIDDFLTLYQNLADSFHALVVAGEYPGYSEAFPSQNYVSKHQLWTIGFVNYVLEVFQKTRNSPSQSFESSSTSHDSNSEAASKNKEEKEVLARKHILSRVFFFSHSVGCLSTAFLSSHFSGLGGSVFLAPFTSVRETALHLLSDAPEFVKSFLQKIEEKGNNRPYMEKIKSPAMFVGFENDELTPIWMSNELCVLTENSPVRYFVTVLNGTHQQPIQKNFNFLLPLLYQFFHRSLEYHRSSAFFYAQQETPSYSFRVEEKAKRNEPNLKKEEKVKKIKKEEKQEEREQRSIFAKYTVDPFEITTLSKKELRKAAKKKLFQEAQNFFVFSFSWRCFKTYFETHSNKEIARLLEGEQKNQLLNAGVWISIVVLAFVSIGFMIWICKRDRSKKRKLKNRQ